MAAITLDDVQDKIRAAISAAELGDYVLAVRLGESAQALRACVPNTEAGGVSLSFSTEGLNAVLEQWRKKAGQVAMAAGMASEGVIVQVPMQVVGAGAFEG